VADQPATPHTAGLPPPGALALMRRSAGMTSTRNCQSCISPVPSRPPGTARQRRPAI